MVEGDGEYNPSFLEHGDRFDAALGDANRYSPNGLGTRHRAFRQLAFGA